MHGQKNIKLLLLCLTDLHPIIFYKHFGMEHLKFKLSTLSSTLRVS